MDHRVFNNAVHYGIKHLQLLGEKKRRHWTRAPVSNNLAHRISFLHCQVISTCNGVQKGYITMLWVRERHNFQWENALRVMAVDRFGRKLCMHMTEQRQNRSALLHVIIFTNWDLQAGNFTCQDREKCCLWTVQHATRNQDRKVRCLEELSFHN